jgi:hypothetical protein
MISSCGLDCEACPIFKAANDPHFAEELASEWRNAGHPKAQAGWFKCQGCHGDDALVWSEDCAIRKCCRHDRKLENCSFCPEFPCELLSRFESDGLAHHRAAVENLRRMKKERPS